MTGVLDTLRSVDSLPFIREASLAFNRFKRAVRPYFPVLTRLLLVSAFVEDAFRTLIEYKSQLVFFKHQLHIPASVALVLIAVSTTATFLGAALVFFRRSERAGARLLLFAVAYQQAVYGRHSPITSGNLGFLIRNLCLIGTLLLLMSNTRFGDSMPSLPGLYSHNLAGASARRHGGGTNDLSNLFGGAAIGGGGGSGGGIGGAIAKRRDSIALATRFLIVLLCGEMFDLIGWSWAVVIVPVAFAVLVGYKTDLMGLLLMGFYVVATVSSKQFWFIDTAAAGSKEYATFQRDVMRFEFLQTISIMSGLVMLIMTGPGQLSVDSKLNRRKAW